MKQLPESLIYKFQNRTIHVPVFIVGSSHSGTSIMLRVLSEHPSLYPIVNETRLFYDHNYKIIITLIDWMIRVKFSGKSGILEKTPGHIFKVDKIFKFIPNAKIICMLRDGRDVACSIKTRQGETFEGFMHGLDVWCNSYQSCMKYFHDPRFKIVKLEEFVVDAKLTLQNICQFLGIKFYDSLLDYHKNTKLFYSNSIERLDNVLDGEGHLRNRNWQINQEIFNSSGKWKASMSQQEKMEFKKRAGSMLIEFGYAEDENW